MEGEASRSTPVLGVGWRRRVGDDSLQQRATLGLPRRSQRRRTSLDLSRIVPISPTESPDLHRDGSYARQAEQKVEPKQTASASLICSQAIDERSKRRKTGLLHDQEEVILIVKGKLEMNDEGVPDLPRHALQDGLLGEGVGELGVGEDVRFDDGLESHKLGVGLGFLSDEEDLDASRARRLAIDTSDEVRGSKRRTYFSSTTSPEHPQQLKVLDRDFLLLRHLDPPRCISRFHRTPDDASSSLASLSHHHLPWRLVRVGRSRSRRGRRNSDGDGLGTAVVGGNKIGEGWLRWIKGFVGLEMGRDRGEAMSEDVGSVWGDRGRRSHGVVGVRWRSGGGSERGLGHRFPLRLAVRAGEEARDRLLLGERRIIRTAVEFERKFRMVVDEDAVGARAGGRDRRESVAGRWRELRVEGLSGAGSGDLSFDLSSGR
jgi:hypothetical protein